MAEDYGSENELEENYYAFLNLPKDASIFVAYKQYHNNIAKFSSTVLYLHLVFRLPLNK